MRFALVAVPAVASALVVGYGVVADRGLSDARPPGGHALDAGDPPPVAPAGTPSAEGITGLTPAMRRSIERAADAAAAAGVELRITSGWRSREHQQRLYEEALRKYGSPERARRWVLPPDESAHVLGMAVDVGPPAGAEWLARHGVRFGLCRRYANEPWHFERLAGAVGSTCPALEPHP